VSAAHRQESVQTDRRWLVVWTSLFVAWLALSGILVVIFFDDAAPTEIYTFIRRVKHEIRWFIPFRKIPKHKRFTGGLQPDQGRRAALDLPGRQIRVAGPDGTVIVEVDLARVRHPVG
jgi:hypothetical protein